ncbi:hypothetical protein BE21_21360 [Sorangium cellulosum]|uniref:Uncharacterized protein n=1 Tax=Sorangium cellulosum TaxID=56 RepID=A0A150TW46_SORCE|nr:hypothetical protein BE21_21360 [Sorangium cellulosum]
MMSLNFRTHDFRSDVYVMRAVPHRAAILLNDGYDASVVFDLVAMAARERVAFAPSVTPYTVHELTVAPSGTWALAFSNDQHDVALRIDLASGKADVLAVPKTAGRVSAFAWADANSPTVMQVTTTDGLLWEATGDALQLATPGPELAAWIGRAKAHVERLDRFAHRRTDFASGKLFVFAKDASEIGWISLDTGEAHLVAATYKAGAVAAIGTLTWVGYRERVVLFRGQREESYFTMPDDEELVALEACEGADGPFLAILTSVKDGPESRLRVARVDV